VLTSIYGLMEFITGLPISKRKDNIFVLVYQLTKYVYFVGVTSKAKDSQILDGYVKIVYGLHRFSKVVVSDRDPKFTNNFWKELFHHVVTTLTMSNAYHPQTYGQNEVVHKCLEG
jgi:hypothetical protein